MPYNEYITKWEDLVTSAEATRKGFVAIAFEKNVKGTPFIEEAKNLKILASRAKKPEDLLGMLDIYPSLLAAASLSEKAQSHLTLDDKKDAISELVKNFLIPAGVHFIDELVYRFLLTKGDALGGIMRNVAGSIAEKKLLRCIISTLSIKGIKFNYLHKDSKSWLSGNATDTTLEDNTKGLYWKNIKGDRTLIMNIKPSFFSNNVDLCLFNGASYEYNNTSSLHKSPSKYLALGELKGGIDPAGADETWKTANTALDRIRRIFLKYSFSPNTFFIGAAIQNNMAVEIYSQLRSNKLSNAANLTNSKQLVSICNWICSLLNLFLHYPLFPFQFIISCLFIC